MSVAVVQPLPGIGDMIWHLPHIRAIAAHEGEAVTVVAKPRSRADRIFAGDPAVADTVWLDRNPDAGKGAADGLGIFAMAAALRRRRFRAAYLLHHSDSTAFLLWLARIPVRRGYGAGVQRLFLNRGPFLTGAEQRLIPADQAAAWLARARIQVTEPEPLLHVGAESRAAARGRVPGPRVVVCVGTSEPYKQWGAAKFAELIRALLDAGWRSAAIVCGPAEAAMAAELAAADSRVVPAVGWDLPEVAALCAESGFYVGNDTGVLNIAAASGVRAYGLFGATPPLTHSARIVAVVPEGGMSKADGMARIGVGDALAAIARDRGGLGP